MAVKCTECGASIQDDSKFCKYCGAKIADENLKRVEVKIDNTAEIRRAEYEEKESRLRQKKMERELRKEKLKPYIVTAKFLSVIVPFGCCFLINSGKPLSLITPIVIGSIFFTIWMVQLFNK